MKLSIIIPVYNKIRYLSTILQQVREQSFADFECLLIDDGSTDGSGAVCDEFVHVDHRFRVFHIPNGGVSHARNVGLDVAKGEYITFIDADDSIKPDYLENLMCLAEDSKADLVISGYEKVSHAGETLHRVGPCNIGIFDFQSILKDFADVQQNTGLYGCCVAKIFPKALVKNIRFNEILKLAEDFDFYLNLYEVIDTVYLDDYAGYLYLQDAENSTGNIDSEKIDYLAQLQINLHYRSMLRKRECWHGENRRIVEDRLSHYAYFTLFHTPIHLYKEKFDTLYKLYCAEDLPLHSWNMLSAWLFYCLQHNQYIAAKKTIQVYRWARRRRG